jgi:hypothetical protein
MKNPPFKVTRHDDHAEIEILTPCAVRWSVDSCTWRSLSGAEAPAGTVLVDSEVSPPRFYAAVVDGQTSCWDEPWPATAMAFQAWFGDDEETR